MAPTLVQPRVGASFQIRTGGEARIAAYGGALGGYIVNPLLAADQGIPVAEPLYVSPAGPAALEANGETIELAPGARYPIPANSALPVWANAATSGHFFSVMVATPAADYPPRSNAGPFPPPGPTTQTKLIPAYLYQEYSDDDALQAFFQAYNELAQNYIDTFNALNLPIYPQPIISGALLDWVGAGIYGLPRPPLASGQSLLVGPLNTYELDALELNQSFVTDQNVIATSDDIYKRILTWHIFKGDGKVFDIRWLKRRVMRFLIGVNGTDPPIDQTNQISVTFGPGGEVSIRFIDSVTTVLRGQILDTCELNSLPLDDLEVEIVPLTPLPNRVIFKEAMDSGALEVPFQFTFEVTV